MPVAYEDIVEWKELLSQMAIVLLAYNCYPNGMKKYTLAIAIIVGILAGMSNTVVVDLVVTNLATIFMNLLKLISMPILFLSIVATIAGMEDLQELKSLGSQVIKYTLLTTVIAASIALLVFLIIQPAPEISTTAVSTEHNLNFNINSIIPSNILQPFIEGNVFAVVILALLFSGGIISLPAEHRSMLQKIFSSLHALIMKITTIIIKALPIAIFAFVALFVKEMQTELAMKSLGFYFICIVLANLIQGFVVLPLFLKYKKISAITLAKQMAPALSLAFWTKSSSAALPVTLECAEKNANIDSTVARFSLPLCTTVNMNACAAFILITVLFVAQTYGFEFSALELVMWIIIASVAAIGNAGVPMGCYFLASALLAYLDVPLYLMGVILPFYSLLDMLESSINVWSDACITKVVATERLSS